MTDASESRPRGRLRVARIAYFTDPAHTEEWMIPVGVIVEVNLPEAHGIATALRQSFSEFELGQMGSAARRMLVPAMDHFRPVVTAAFADAPRGCALDAVAGQYSTPLCLLPPKTPDFPQRWLTPRDVQAVKEHLRVLATDAYFEFVYSLRDEAGDPATAEEIRGAA